MKQIRIIVMLLCGALLLGLCACGGVKKKNTELIKSFLTEYYTLNKDDRFRSFSDAVATDPSDAVKPFKEYYGYAGDLTEKFLDYMLSSRLSTKYDRLAQEKGLTVTVESVELKETGDGEYEYTLKLTMNDGSSSKEYEALGKVRLSDDDEPKIKELTVNSIRDGDGNIFGA